MTKEHLAACEKRLDGAHDLLERIRTDVRGAQEFRDAVFDLLEGTPFGAQADSTYDGLYGRLRAALERRLALPAWQPDAELVAEFRRRAHSLDQENDLGLYAKQADLLIQALLAVLPLPPSAEAK